MRPESNSLEAAVASEKKVLVPDIGDFSGVEVIEVLVSEGDRIEVESSLVTLESDKATMEIPSTHAGLVKAVAVKVGDTISEGDLLVVVESEQEEKEEKEGEREPAVETSVEDDNGGDDDFRPPEPAAEELETVQAPAPVAAEPGGESHRRPGDKAQQPPPVAAHPSDVPGGVAHASPSVRAFARELGVDLTRVQGSGRKGRITREDVQNHIRQMIKSGGAAAPAGSLRLPAVPEIDFSQFGEVEEQPLSRIKRISGSHLTACWLNIPHVTQFDEADITGLEAFRQAQKGEAERQEIKLTFMPFLMKACVGALQQMPEFNSSLSPDRETLLYKRYFNIGVAVDTPNGLTVPVIREVDRKSIFTLARELAEVSGRAREGKLAPADLQGGCFSISSLGGIGGTAFTPIVNAPEVAILGVSRSSMQPVWNGNEFTPRLILPLSLSYDHRVIDGAQAARFTVLLSTLLADIRRLLL
ncbi:MAG: dihydrolipoyllysine-residue acetyltransferase [Sedimenticola sp.]|nr:dihydrolipoyllysine-residue acetyltransferase [Sedimenticola sp.]